MNVKRLWQLIVCAGKNWASDNASTLGASLAFYCAFSIAPLLVLLVSAASWAVGADVAYGFIGEQLSDLFGSDAAKTLVEAARQSRSAEGIVATVISAFTLLIGATTVFAAIDAALETIWGTKALAPSGLKGFIRTRLLSIGFILAVAFLLLISLTLSTALTALKSSIMNRFGGMVALWAALDFVMTTAMCTALFSLAYRYMPARRIAWRLALSGALVTALLFQFGRWAIGFYLGKSTQPSTFGAAASFVALLLWLYYSAQIFLFGAEFTSCMAGLRHTAPDKKKASPDSKVRIVAK